MNKNLAILGLIIMLTAFQSCLNNGGNETKNKSETKYSGEIYRLMVGNLGIAKLKNLKGQSILSSDELKEINKSKFQDTLITFEPTYFYEKAKFIKGIILSDALNVIDAGIVGISKFDIGSGMIQLINNSNKNDKLALTRISVELRGAKLIEKRSINLHPIMESQKIEVANEIIRKESDWLFEGLENFNKIILSDLEFRSEKEFVKIDNPVLINLR